MGVLRDFHGFAFHVRVLRTLHSCFFLFLSYLKFGARFANFLTFTTLNPKNTIFFFYFCNAGQSTVIVAIQTLDELVAVKTLPLNMDLTLSYFYFLLFLLLVTDALPSLISCCYL